MAITKNTFFEKAFWNIVECCIELRFNIELIVDCLKDYKSWIETDKTRQTTTIEK